MEVYDINDVKTIGHLFFPRLLKKKIFLRDEFGKVRELNLNRFWGAVLSQASPRPQKTTKRFSL